MELKAFLAKIKSNATLINGALFSLFSFVNKGFGFLLLLLLANYMPPAEYGYLGLFQTVIMLVGYFISLQVEGYMSVSFFNDDRRKFEETVSGIFFVVSFMSILFSCILFIFGKELSRYLELPVTMLEVSIPICAFTVLANINLDMFRLNEKITRYGVYSISNATINFVLSIILVKYLLFGWEGRVWAQAFSYSIFGLLSIVYFLSHKYISLPSWPHFRKMLLYGIPLIPHLGTNFIKQGCDRYIINAYHSIDEVGLFTFALNLTNVIIMIGIGFNQSNSVDIYKVLGNKELSVFDKMAILKKQRQYIMKIYLGFSLLFVFFTYFFLPLLLPKYSQAMNYFLVLSIFGFLNCLYFLYTNYLFFYKKTKQIMYVTFGTSILHLLLSLFLTRYSLYFTSLIYSISIGTMVFLIRYLALKEIRKQIY